MSLMNLREYARYRGCYPRAVEAAIAAGRIQRNEQGLIDSEQADVDWAANTSPYRSSAAKGNASRGQAIRRELEHRAPAPAPAIQSPQRDSPPHRAPTDLGTYAAARAERERHQADLAKLTLEERQGKLIPADRVRRSAEEHYRQLRDSLMGIPDRLPELTFDQRQAVDMELRNALERAGNLEELLKRLEGVIERYA